MTRRESVGTTCGLTVALSGVSKVSAASVAAAQLSRGGKDGLGIQLGVLSGMAAGQWS